MNTTPLNRQHLLDRMTGPDIPPITLVTAPAGYGKSTLAAQWTERFPGPVASIAMTASSNTLGRVVQQVIKALQRAGPDVPAPASDHLTPDDIFDYGAAILEHAGALGVVIDDYHLIENQDIHDTLSGFLHNLMPNVHILLLSRTMPPLSLGRLHAHGYILHLTEADLSFTPDEIAHITQGLSLTPSEVRRLASRTEGWIAGIRLAMLSIGLDDGTTRERLNQFLATFHQNQWLDDYITEEVLNRLPAELREFVLQTAILETLTPELCDTMLGIDNSAMLLQELEDNIVFVSRSSLPDDHLVYHRLFAEGVDRISRRIIPAGQRRQHHLRAARWLEEHDEPMLAFRHALAISDREVIERLAITIVAPLARIPQPHSVLFWLKQLPVGIRRDNLQISYWYIKALYDAAHFLEAAEELARIRPLLESSASSCHRAWLAVLDATNAVFTGDNDRALSLWYDALQDLSPDDHTDRLQSWTVIAQLESLRGHDDAAERAFREAYALAAHFPAGDNSWVQHLASNRANHYALRADLISAEELYCHQLTQVILAQQHLKARYHSRLAIIYLEWSQMDRAREAARLTIDSIRDSKPLLWHTEALLFAAQVFWADGDMATAERIFQDVAERHRQQGGKNTMRRAEALHAQAMIATGQLTIAREWAKHHAQPDHPFERIYGERDLRIPRLIMLVADKRWDEASALIQEALSQTEAIRHQVALLEFSVWQAIVEQATGDTETAQQSLRTAVRIGTPGRFVRSFFPAGHDLRPLLRAIRPTVPASEAAWIDHLIRHAPLPPEAELPETREHRPAIQTPLTPSETRVLTLLNEGWANKQIADQLFITERTVKKHVSNILRKLEVSNRTAAVSRAHEVGIL